MTASPVAVWPRGIVQCKVDPGIRKYKSTTHIYPCALESRYLYGWFAG